MLVRVISWNIAGRTVPGHSLVEMDADVALLQEATEPREDIAKPVHADPAPWQTAGRPGWPCRTAIVRLSVEWINAKSLGCATSEDLAVSQLGTLTAARVTALDMEPLVVVSMCTLWENPHASTRSSWIVSDASTPLIFSPAETVQTGDSPQPPHLLNRLHQPRPIRSRAVDGAADRPSRHLGPLRAGLAWRVGRLCSCLGPTTARTCPATGLPAYDRVSGG